MPPNTPTSSFTQPTKISNPWKITAIALIILTSILISFSAFLLIEKLDNKTAQENTSNPDSENTTPLDDDKTPPTYAFAVVQEWNVKFKIPDGLFNVNYSTHQGSGNGKYFAANGFHVDAFQTDDANFCIMGSLHRFSDNDIKDPSDPFAIYTEKDKENAIKLGDYYYIYLTHESPQACDNAKNTALIKQMLSTPQSIE